MKQGQTIALSLVAHTNVGKTTLARTLLARDVGEVRDGAHVTELAQAHELLSSPEGDVLQLWDTPGFGDSARLVRRMRLDGHPLGWLLSQLWDRWRDRAFWSSQQALRHVRERSDLVLYLVNAAEPQAGYLDAELQLLAWLDKPVLVLLNQLGAPREAAAEAAELAAWRTRLTAHAVVRDVLPLDAFARCWVQEAALWRAVQRALPGHQTQAMARLAQAWGVQREAVFDAAMATLATSLARTATSRQLMPDAQAALARAAQEDVQASTQRLLELHGQHGQASAPILERVAQQVALHARLPEGKAALWGGVVSGALLGLKADIASGGLTLGGGMLAGGLLGALGAGGVARGVNLLRGAGPGWAGWKSEALTPMVHAALLRYLAVAHFGRGRGSWQEGEAPAFWHEVAAQALAPHEATLATLWQSRRDKLDNAGDAAALAVALQPLLTAATRRALSALYPSHPPTSAPT
jgi:50S ribosome-binding GTPase/Domain of unknown function (DUF3482)